MTVLAAAALAVALLAVRGPGGRPLRTVAGRRADRPSRVGPIGEGSRAGPGSGVRVEGRDRVLGARPGAGQGRAGRDGDAPHAGHHVGGAPVGGDPVGRAPTRRRHGGVVARRLGSRGAARAPDLAVLVTDVAARLRAGVDPARAWSQALGQPVGADGPMVADLCRTAERLTPAATVVAATRLAAELGAPLAPVLDAVAGRLAADAEAEGERRAALAGPRATARVLTGLPVLGVLLGVAVGAEPVAVLLDGGVGSAALAAGLALVLAGRVWTARLARAAADAGRSP